MKPCGEVKSVNKKYVSYMFLHLLRISGLVNEKLLLKSAINI